MHLIEGFERTSIPFLGAPDGLPFRGFNCWRRVLFLQAKFFPLDQTPRNAEGKVSDQISTRAEES